MNTVKFNLKDFSFKKLTLKLQVAVLRFPVTLLLVAGVAGLLFVEINRGNIDISYRWWIFLIIGSFISLTTTLWLENLENCLWKYATSIVSVTLWGIFCCFLPETDNGLHTENYLQIGITGVVTVVAAFFISFLKKNRDMSFWTFSVVALFQLAVAVIFGGILQGGLSLALFSVDSLFGVEISWKAYGNLSVVCNLLFAVIYFLANIPDKNDKYSEKDFASPKILKILGLYILTPILSIYMLILYAYLAKIMVEWQLPNGWVSALVSVLATGGLLITLLLYPIFVKKENKFAVFLSRWFGALVLPLLVLMTVSITRRISDYGITIARLYVLLLNIWFYGIYIYLFLTQSKHIKWILISPAAVALLASFGPWRISNLTKIHFQHKLENAFSQLDFLENGKISQQNAAAHFANVDTKTKEQIHQSIDYLADNYGEESVQPFFSDTIKQKNMYSVLLNLGLTDLKTKENNTRYFWYADIQKGGNIIEDIDKYDTFVSINCTNGNQNLQDITYSFDKQELTITINATQRQFSIPVQKLALARIDNHQAETTLTIQGEDYLIVLKNFNGYCYENNDEITLYGLEGYLFYKK